MLPWWVLALAGYALGAAVCLSGLWLIRKLRGHGRCSIYSPCRADDLDAAWQSFRRAVDDPATRGETIRSEMARMAARRPVEWPQGGRHG